MAHPRPPRVAGRSSSTPSVRLDIRRIETIKDGTESVGNRVKVKVAKNKMAPPFRQAEFDIMFGEGISREGSLLDVAVDHGVVRKSGAWFTFDDDQLGQGRENAKRFLRENPEVAMQLQAKVYELVGLGESPRRDGRRDHRRGGRGRRGRGQRAHGAVVSHFAIGACSIETSHETHL